MAFIPGSHMLRLFKDGRETGSAVPRVRTHYFHTLQKRVGMETEVTMSTLFYLSSAQMDTIRPFFPRSRGVPRVDDQKILSGIIYVLKFGLQWKDAPKEYGPYKTLYNRFVRWSNMGVFKKIFTALSESTQDTSLLMIDATCLKAHRTAASLRKKGFLSLYRTHKRRIEHQITCSL